MSSVSEAKAELIKLGLSTHTPGMVGLERLDELRARLDSAKSKTRALLLGDNASTSNLSANQLSQSSFTSNPSVLSSLSELPISEIRSRLNALGVNTSTPGLNGDERRAELMKRLVGSICGSNANNDDSESDV